MPSTVSTSRSARARPSASSASRVLASRRSPVWSPGLLSPTAGTVEIGGVDLARLGRRADAGAAPRRPGRLPGSVRRPQPASPGRVDHRRPTGHPRCAEGDDPRPRRGADGARRAQPRAPQPLSGRLLRRPATAHRRRPRPRPRAAAGHLRRAGVGARRVGAGADHQPAAAVAGRARPHLPRRLPRPRRHRAHRRPGGGDVPRPHRRDRHHRRAVRAPPAIPTRGRCSTPFRWPIQANAGASSSSPATCRHRSPRRADAASTLAAATPRPTAPSRTQRSSPEPATPTIIAPPACTRSPTPVELRR